MIIFASIPFLSAKILFKLSVISWDILVKIFPGIRIASASAESLIAQMRSDEQKARMEYFLA